MLAGILRWEKAEEGGMTVALDFTHACEVQTEARKLAKKAVTAEQLVTFHRRQLLFRVEYRPASTTTNEVVVAAAQAYDEAKQAWIDGLPDDPGAEGYIAPAGDDGAYIDAQFESQNSVAPMPVKKPTELPSVVFPDKVVCHDQNGPFADLIAALVADTLQEDTYGKVAERLATKKGTEE